MIKNKVLKKHEATVDEIITVNDYMKYKLSKRYPKVSFKQSTTLNIAKDIVLFGKGERRT